MMPDREDCRRADHFGQYASKKGHGGRAAATLGGDSGADSREKQGDFWPMTRGASLATSLLSYTVL
jgi:hypothetical protein